ncbi:hypothetical protein Taro_030521 [Colocasia esculenta]|uniref:Uncharacterized protein n=1 Tax=Colocasia esculenta TaxID=4460 RepID=A0A843W0F5_COLES|nr:hypothetical protein [Colocasia esculenta]
MDAHNGRSYALRCPLGCQDEARASDKLLRAGIRNGEGYVTEYMLVKYGLSKPWTAAELEAGRDQEANEDFAEQIPVLAHMVYEDDDVAAVVRVPSAVRVGSAVTTALVAPSPVGGRPAKAQAPEKRPGKIRLKRKATKEVVPAGARASPAEGDGASRSSASAKKRPVLFKESAEEAEELRAGKRKKTVQATPPRDEEGTEEEEEAQLLLRRRSRAVKSADEGVPQVGCPEVTQKMATELGLIFVSEGSGSPVGGEARGSTCSRDRESSGASIVGGAEHGATSNTAEASPRRRGEIAASPVRREEDADAMAISAPVGVVASSAIAPAPSAAPSEGQEVVPAAGATEKVAATTGTSEGVAATLGGILPPVPPTEVVAIVNATSKVVEDTGADAAGAGDGVRAEESEDDRRPLSEALLKKLPAEPSVAALEATLRRMENAPRDLPASPTASHLDQLARCLDLPSETTPERPVEGYHPEGLDDEGMSDIDLEALADGMSKSLVILKALAARGQKQKYLNEAQAAFCKDLSARHKACETVLEEEVKNLKAALQASELEATLARAEKEALTKVVVDAGVRAVADYKAGPEYQEDLEQYGARCYRVGLNAGKDLGERLSWVDRAREAFEAAVWECRHRTQDARLDGVRFAQFQFGRMPPSGEDAGPSQQAP